MQAILNQSNIASICNEVAASIQRRYGIQSLPAAHQEKLRKRANFFASEYVKKPSTGISITEVNRLIAIDTAHSFEDFLIAERVIAAPGSQARSSQSVQAPQQMYGRSAPVPQPQQIQTGMGGRPQAPIPMATSVVARGGTSEDVTRRFEQLSRDREATAVSGGFNNPVNNAYVNPVTGAGTSGLVAPLQGNPFLTPIDDRTGGPDPITQYEREQKRRREEEASRFTSEDNYAAAQSSAQSGAERTLAAILERNTQFAAPVLHVRPPPDRPVEWLMGMTGARDTSTSDRISMDVRTVPVIGPTELQTQSQTQSQSDVAIVRQQNFLPIPPPASLVREIENIGPKYRQVQHSLYIFSGDRDWYNSTDTRYAFKVLFGAINGAVSASETTLARTQAAAGITDKYACLRADKSLMPVEATVQKRFQNVTCIEMIKLVVPNECVDVISTRTVPLVSDSSTPLIQNLNPSSFQYLQMVINEFDSDSVGSSAQFERVFGVVHPDGCWTLDKDMPNRGYTLMIPKHMHCRREYYPTPHSTFQSMTIRVERPSGDILSELPDVFTINSIAFGNDISGGFLGPSESSFTLNDTNNNPMYIYVITSQWFPATSIQSGDRMVFQGYKTPTPTNETYITPSITTAFETWMNDPEGHYAMESSYKDASGTVLDGANSVGYTNMFVIRNQFADPKTGATTRQLWGTLNQEIDLRRMVAMPFDTGIVCKAINMNRQVQLSFRVHTRELDAGTVASATNV